ncbi:MAG: alanine--glyoxylate aminotransferase family protein [Bacillota bacterium]|nr:MAG: alanine--glyoxylate aminotransferase family protein [Bacillota bacterium]
MPETNPGVNPCAGPGAGLGADPGLGLPRLPELSLPERTLLGPGPSNVHPRVLRALSYPCIGHLDPAFIEVMNGTVELLRHLFRTRNRLTMPVSGTGSAGMEAALVNFIEPGDTVVVGVNGLFGERMCDIAGRSGARLVRVDAPWGEPLDRHRLLETLARNPGAKALCVVHAETSTGVLQPLDGLGRACREHGALLIVDAVTSLGGVPVETDAWGLDVVYSGTQKCLSCPPGLAPLTASERAVEVLKARRTKVQSWYLDLPMLVSYWGTDRFYHHTAPTNMIIGLHEALRLIAEEGLGTRHARHRRNGRALLAGLRAMGLEPFAREEFRIPMLLSVKVPDGVDDLAVRKDLLERCSVEIGGGLGPTKGKIWRIGLLGHSSQRENVTLVLGGLEAALRRQGFTVDKGAGIAAAETAYEEE